MPKFGYDEIGHAGIVLTNNIRGSYFTCPESGVAESITAALYGMASGDATVKCALYKKSDNSFVGETEEKTVSLAVPTYWKTFNFLSPKPLLEGGVDYYIVVWGKDGTTSPNIKRTLEINKGGYQSWIYNGFPDPWSPTAEDYKYSVYCTYILGPPPEHILTISATPGGTTDPAPSTYTYYEGATATVTAIPETGYYFNHWELDGVDIGVAVPYSLIMDTDHTLHAVFTTEAPAPPAPPIDVATAAGIALAIVDIVLIGYALSQLIYRLKSKDK